MLKNMTLEETAKKLELNVERVKYVYSIFRTSLDEFPRISGAGCRRVARGGVNNEDSGSFRLWCRLQRASICSRTHPVACATPLRIGDNGTADEHRTDAVTCHGRPCGTT